MDHGEKRRCAHELIKDSSVAFPEQGFLSLAEAQRRGDFVGFRRFSERGSIHPLGEGSSPSVRLDNPASSFEKTLFPD